MLTFLKLGFKWVSLRLQSDRGSYRCPYSEICTPKFKTELKKRNNNKIKDFESDRLFTQPHTKNIAFEP